MHGSLPAQASVTLTAQKLEAGEGNPLTGRLGDGAGKWRLTVRAAQPVLVMSLLHATQSGLQCLGARETGPALRLRDPVHGRESAQANVHRIRCFSLGELYVSKNRPECGDDADLVRRWPAM